MNNYLAVDLGASSYRIVLANDEDLFEIITRKSDHLVKIKTQKMWDLKVIYNAIIEALITVEERNIKLTSLAINSWGCDFASILDSYKFDDEGRLLTPIFASCYLNEQAPSKLLQMSNEQLYSLTAINIQPFNTLLRYDQIRSPITFIASYLNYLLTGVLIADYTIASTSQMLMRDEQRYDLQILQAFSIKEEYLPPLAAAGSYQLPIKNERFKHINVIYGAGHDTAYALYYGDGSELILNIGSWTIIGLNIQKPHQFISKYNYERGLLCKYKLVENILGMNVFNMLINELALDNDFTKITCQLFKSNYEHIDITKLNIQKQLCTQFPPHLSAYELLASYLQSLARYTAGAINQLLKSTQSDCSKIIIVGGGQNNEYYISALLASLDTKLQVERGPVEATVAGNIKFQKEIANGNIEST